MCLQETRSSRVDVGHVHILDMCHLLEDCDYPMTLVFNFEMEIDTPVIPTNGKYHANFGSFSAFSFSSLDHVSRWTDRWPERQKDEWAKPMTGWPHYSNRLLLLTVSSEIG